MDPTDHLKIKIQLCCGDEIAMGPGKADLLDAIAREGSISGAARALGMSYRRAWQLVDVMNRCWREAIVVTSPGSSHGGGARLTDFGAAMLAHYRALQRALDSAVAGPILAELSGALLAAPRESQKA